MGADIRRQWLSYPQRQRHGDTLADAEYGQQFGDTVQQFLGNQMSWFFTSLEISFCLVSIHCFLEFVSCVSISRIYSVLSSVFFCFDLFFITCLNLCLVFGLHHLFGSLFGIVVSCLCRALRRRPPPCGLSFVSLHVCLCLCRASRRRPPPCGHSFVCVARLSVFSVCCRASNTNK